MQFEATEMVEAFEIDSEARMTKSKATVVEVDTNRVLVFIVHENKTVYLWRGKGADIFKKLMGTRAAAQLSHKYPDYRIRPISEDNEPAAFKHLLGTKLD
jgi:hypothetical protein